MLGLGSAGVETARFDDFSDLDFFVVVADRAAKDRFVADLGWLGGLGGTVAYAFRNTADGCKVLLDDGLFLEYAVFTPDELADVPYVGARIVWRRSGLTLPAAAVPPPGAPKPVEHHVGEAVTNLYVGLCRELRGERLAATRFIQGYAIDQVLALLRLDEGTVRHLPDPFEATRRIERATTDRRPPWEQMLPGYERNAAAAAATLGWLRRWYPVDAAMAAAVERLVERARP